MKGISDVTLPSGYGVMVRSISEVFYPIGITLQI